MEISFMNDISISFFVAIILIVIFLLILFYIRKHPLTEDDIDIIGNNEKIEIKCPYCHSNNTKKISGLSRFSSVGFFGLSSKKIGKQWHCNNCNSDF